MRNTELESLVEAINNGNLKCSFMYFNDDMVVYEGKFGQDYMVKFCNVFPFAVIDTVPGAPWAYFHIEVHRDSVCDAILSWFQNGTSVANDVCLHWR